MFLHKVSTKTHFFNPGTAGLSVQVLQGTEPYITLTLNPALQGLQYLKTALKYLELIPAVH